MVRIYQNFADMLSGGLFRGMCNGYDGNQDVRGMWVYGDLITTLTPRGKMVPCPAITTTDGTRGTYFVAPDSIGMFTGVVLEGPRYGKMLYTGDIVKLQDGFTYKVSTTNGALVLVSQTNGDAYGSLYVYANRICDVVGPDFCLE